jgi:hypothetical protein
MVGCLQGIHALCVDISHWVGDSSNFHHRERRTAGPVHIVAEWLHTAAESPGVEREWAQALVVHTAGPVHTVANSEWEQVQAPVVLAAREGRHRQMDC